MVATAEWTKEFIVNLRRELGIARKDEKDEMGEEIPDPRLHCTSSQRKWFQLLRKLA